MPTLLEIATAGSDNELILRFEAALGQFAQATASAKTYPPTGDDYKRAQISNKAQRDIGFRTYLAQLLLCKGLDQNDLTINNPDGFYFFIHGNR